jgi:hypothetical protein
MRLKASKIVAAAGRGEVDLQSYVLNSPCDGAETLVVTDVLLPQTDIRRPILDLRSHLASSTQVWEEEREMT